MSVDRTVLFVAGVCWLLARSASAAVCSTGGVLPPAQIAATGVVTASSNPATAGNLIDGNFFTGWSAAPGTTSVVVTWEAPADVVIARLYFPFATPSFQFTTIFVELLDASDVVLASGAATLLTSTNQGDVFYSRQFDAGNQTLRKIRLTVDSSASPGTLGLTEISIYSPVPMPPPILPGPGPEELTPAATFQGVGDGAGGAFLSRANGVSPDGRLVAGETETSPGKLRGFRFADGSLTTLGSGTSLLTTSLQTFAYTCVTADQSRGFAASNTGIVVGNTCLGSTCGVTLFGGGPPQVYEPPATGIIFSNGNYASDITADGVASTGMYNVQLPSLPQWGSQIWFRLIGPDYTGLGGYSLGGGISTPPRIAPGGDCVVATVNTGVGAPDQTASVGTCGTLPTETATDVSPGGTHIVGSIGGLAARGLEVLGDLAGGAASSRALGVSDDGNTVVGWGTTATGQEAFVWTPAAGIRRLADVLTEQGVDLTGWTLREATGISASGRTIVGWGTNPSAQTEGFVATVVRAPSVPALQGRGLAWLAAALALTAAPWLTRAGRRRA